MKDDLTGLVELMRVAERRSFTAAAAELRVTPSAMSQAIRALEHRVGMRLLQRTTRSVGLTEAGARFIARLAPALAEVHEAFESLAELRDRPAGTLRLTVPRFGYEQVLAPKLRAFLDAYPDVDVDCSIDEAYTDIVTQGFDAGIRSGETVEREMIGVRVSEDVEMAVVGSPAYFARHPAPKHPRELEAHDCINYRQRSLGTIYRWQFTEKGKGFDIALDGRVLLNDGALMLDAALDGLGLAYVIESTAREHIRAKRLVRVLRPFSIPFPGFFLYYPSREQVAPKLKVLVDFIRLRRAR